ncbi:MAG: hypothetical protein ABI442_06790 [Gemmatimonadaceae bacterium]
MSRSSPSSPPSRAASGSHAASRSAGDATSRLRRIIPWWAVAITIVVLVSSAFAVDAIWDAATFDGVGEARLGVTTGYLSIAPLSAVLDTLTLLTIPQHIAIVVTAILVYAGIRWRRASARPKRILTELVAALGFLVALVLVYAAVAVLPRPMAGLVVSDETVLAIDFHAHTKYSHDGRWDWTEDDVRDWHRSAGYDAVYITDHATFEGAERGIATNPPVAGEGEIVLQGLEAFYKGEHVNILSAGRHYRGLTNATLKDIDPEALGLASLLPQSTPLLIETVPGNLDKVPASTDKMPVGVQAIEIVDGSPRGLTQGRRDHNRIIKIADSLNLALVTGSDNHGWGRAAPGWTLMRIGGWRGMPTDSLSSRIEHALREGRRAATRTAERRVAEASNPAEVVFAAPLVLWRMFTTLSPDERVMWLIWTWGAVLVMRAYRTYRNRPPAAA